MRDYDQEYKDAQEAKEVKTVTPSYVEFKKKGDTVVGLLKGKTSVKSSAGEGFYNQYVVETSKGMVKFALGAATDREIQATVKAGHTYAFTFEEKVALKGGRSVNKFKVVEFGEPEVEEAPPDDEIPF
uniref:Uncharacterized protein n=1 Tax=viral metagenome TaxID=1070528 RepID=A0A6H1ZNP2_9ZZZZ